MSMSNPNSAVHPTDVTPSDPLAQPVSAATGAQLLAKLGITEGEALAIIAAPQATPEELKLAEKVDLHALSHAIDADTSHALATDPKLELGPNAQNFEARAANVRVLGSAEDKLHLAIEDLHGAARLDAAAVQLVLNEVVPQIRSRARANPAVRQVYSSIIAYQHARYPGHRAVVNAAKVAAPAEPNAAAKPAAKV